MPMAEYLEQGWVPHEWWEEYKDKAPEEVSHQEALIMGMVWRGDISIQQNQAPNKSAVFRLDTNSEKDFLFIEKAMENRANKLAQIVYAVYLLYGIEGVGKNRERAKDVFEAIPKEELEPKNYKDNFCGHFFLAILLEHPHFGNDTQKSYRCFQNARALRPKSQATLTLLGDMYRENFYYGEGLEKNNIEASFLYRCAINNSTIYINDSTIYISEHVLSQCESLFNTSKNNLGVVYHYALTKKMKQTKEAKRLLIQFIKNEPQSFLSLVVQYDRETMAVSRMHSILSPLIFEHRHGLLQHLSEYPTQYQQLLYLWLGRHTEWLRSQGKLKPEDKPPGYYYQHVISQRGLLSEPEQLILASCYYDQAVRQQRHRTNDTPAVIRDQPYFLAMSCLASLYQTNDDAAFMMATLMIGYGKQQINTFCHPDICRETIAKYDGQYQKDKAAHEQAQRDMQNLVLALQAEIVTLAKTEAFVFSFFYYVVNFICQVPQFFLGVAWHYGETIAVKDTEHTVSQYAVSRTAQQCYQILQNPGVLPSQKIQNCQTLLTSKLQESLKSVFFKPRQDNTLVYASLLEHINKPTNPHPTLTHRVTI